MAANLELSFDQHRYPAGFWHWMKDNAHIYMAFKNFALQMAATGRKRYSARTIVEVMRWQTDLKDTDKQWKINGNYVPGLARLFMSDHGDKYPDFFLLRDSLGRDE